MALIDEGVYTLVPSSHRGRYACDHPEGSDLTSGHVVEVLLGGYWIAGSIEHSSPPTPAYPDMGGVYTVSSAPGSHSGYYFVSEQGEVCGLCVGMKVRLVW